MIFSFNLLVQFAFLYYFCTPKVVFRLYRWQQQVARGKSGQHRVLHLRNYKLLVTVGERQKKITAPLYIEIVVSFDVFIFVLFIIWG